MGPACRRGLDLALQGSVGAFRAALKSSVLRPARCSGSNDSPRCVRPRRRRTILARVCEGRRTAAAIAALGALALALAACDLLLGLSSYRDVACAFDCGADAGPDAGSFFALD